MLRDWSNLNFIFDSIKCDRKGSGVNNRKANDSSFMNNYYTWLNDYQKKSLAKFPRLGQSRCGSRAYERACYQRKLPRAGFSLVTLRLKETDLFIFRGTSSAACSVLDLHRERETERECVCYARWSNAIKRSHNKFPLNGTSSLLCTHCRYGYFYVITLA